MPITMRGAATATWIQRVPLSEPSCQKTISSRAWVSPRNVMNAMTAPATALTATPVSTSVTTSVRPFWRAVR